MRRYAGAAMDEERRHFGGSPALRLGPTDHPLIRRLNAFCALEDPDRAAIAEATHCVRRLAPREEVVGEDAAPGGATVFLSGFACRSKLLADGRRQIVSYLLPGDCCDLHVGLLQRMDHAITAITPITVSILSPEAVEGLTRPFPRITQALRWARLVEEAISREWLVNIGQRTAYERMASLLCEVHLRLAAVGLVRNGQSEFPLTQSELAETLGLSSVHVNRTLQELRRDGLIVLSGRKLTIRDLPALAAAGMYDAAYLHLEQRRTSLSNGARAPGVNFTIR
jgi:CRP-like cAMP-binding protein